MPGLFITATGTDVGKTFVTAGLIRAARRAGRAVGALKPVLSGYDAADAAASDVGVLLAALGQPLTGATIEAISPWRFAAPLSPDMAAAAEHRQLDLAELLTACRVAVATDQLMFIEGVGGVMVPMNERDTVLDLMSGIALPVVLVTGTYLGALSHCLTAVSALASRGIPPKMLVLNESAGSPVSTVATKETLQRFCPGIEILILPRAPADQVFDDLLSRVVAACSPSRERGSAA